MSNELSDDPREPGRDRDHPREPGRDRDHPREPGRDRDHPREPGRDRDHPREPGRDQDDPREPDGEDAGDFQSAFWAAKHALTVASAAAFSRHGVYEGQQFILRRLWADDGSAPGEIARQLGLATSTVTRAATRMEAAGLLRREPHEADRRLVRLRLTERGRALEEVIDREMDQLTARALSSFGPGERSAFTRALRDIRRNLEAS